MLRDRFQDLNKLPMNLQEFFPTKETRGIYAYELNYYFRITTYIVKLMAYAIEKMKSGSESECTL